MKKMLVMIACVGLLCACGGSSKPQPTEETKTLPASNLVMKGKHAKLFKLGRDDYQVQLVETNNGWQVRVKMTITHQTDFDQIKDHQNYACELKSVYGVLLNSSDVEVERLEMNESDWNELLQEEVGEENVITGKTWDYNHFDYSTAKAIFDKTVGVQITGIELKPVEKGKSSKLIDGETKEAIDDMKDILEAEGEMLNALKDLF